MRADNSHHLKAAAARRSEDTRRRAEAAIADLLRDGTPVTAAKLRQRAKVSRSWLCSQPDLVAKIARRHNGRRGQAVKSPSRSERASHHSCSGLLSRTPESRT